MDLFQLEVLPHQLVHRPANIQAPQIAVMLSNAQKNNWNSSRMNHADECAHHIAHGIALGDDEAVHTNAVIAELALVQCQ